MSCRFCCVASGRCVVARWMAVAGVAAMWAVGVCAEVAPVAAPARPPAAVGVRAPPVAAVIVPPVVCRMERSLDSGIPKRVCRTKADIARDAARAREVMDRVDQSSQGPRMPSG